MIKVALIQKNMQAIQKTLRIQKIIQETIHPNKILQFIAERFTKVTVFKQKQKKTHKRHGKLI